MNDRPIFVSMSGGKDSTATALFLKEHDIKFTPIFSNTGWEHDLTYKYIKDVLEPIFGTFIKVRNEKYLKENDEWAKGFEQAVLYHKRFPDFHRKFCTIDLKVVPLQNFYSDIFLKTKVKPITCLGIRADESFKRSKQVKREEKDETTLYRPILNWSLNEVIEIHKKYNIEPNPLYLKGMSRVGCFPCIYANKSEIRVLAKLHPERFEHIDKLEKKINDIQEQRGKKRTYTFFSSKRSDNKPMFINEVIEWAQTNRKGNLYNDEQQIENSGCVSWGLCEKVYFTGDQLELFKISEPK